MTVVTSRPSKQQKMAEQDSNDELRYNLPNCLISDHILPFVDRSTWDNLVVANREIYQGSRNLEAPWPVGDLIRRVDYEEDEENEEEDEITDEDIDHQVSFSSDGKYLCFLTEQRIRLWNNVVGSCGHIAVDVHNRFVCFSPVENLLVSLHIFDNHHAFRLWEVNTGGLVFKAEVGLEREVDIVGCTFSRDGSRLILYCDDSNLRIYSVSDDSQLIEVIHLHLNQNRNRNREDAWMLDACIGITANGHQAITVGYDQTNQRVRLWDVHGGGSTFEKVYVCKEDEYVSKIATSSLDDYSIAIMTSTGVIKLAHRRARDITWTVEAVAEGKCFDTMSFSTSGQLLATVSLDGGVEIWDAIKGKYLRTLVCDRLSMLQFSPDGSLLAATSSDGRLCLYNI
jgi:WD40 repeat protein